MMEGVGGAASASASVGSDEAKPAFIVYAPLSITRVRLGGGGSDLGGFFRAGAMAVQCSCSQSLQEKVVYLQLWRSEINSAWCCGWIGREMNLVK